MAEKFDDREPPADMREMATQMHYVYVALTQAGFTEGQAMHLLSQALSAALGGISS
jgi:hypothetical protein